MGRQCKIYQIQSQMKQFCNRPETGTQKLRQEAYKPIYLCIVWMVCGKERILSYRAERTLMEERVKQTVPFTSLYISCLPCAHAQLFAVFDCNVKSWKTQPKDNI